MRRKQRQGGSTSTVRHRGWIVALLVLGGLCVGVGCRQPRRTASAPVEATSSRVDVLLRATHQADRELSFSLARVELVDESGAVHALAIARRSIAASTAERRTPLAGSIVPPARYTALRLTLDGAWLERGGERTALALEPAGGELADSSGAPHEPTRTYELPLDLRLLRRDAASVFVDWHVAASSSGGLGFAPRFTSSLERPQTSLGMLYVADAATGSVHSFDRSSGQVVGTYKAGDGPAALALARDRRRLAVANAGDGSLSILDVRRGQIESSVPIGFSANTADVVLVEFDRYVVAANPGLDVVSFAEFGPGGVVQNVTVGRGPTRLASAPDLARLYVCESGNDSVSVIDVNSRAIVGRVPVEARPTDVEVSGDETEVYVGHRTSPNLLVLDARSLGKQTTVFVGGDVTDVLADPDRSRIYVARARPAEIAIIERRASAVVRRIPLSTRVEALALTLEGGRLYAVAPESGALISIDLVLGSEETVMPCGTRPVDVVIAE
ncbi:MAG: YncE family protein [Planctomycetes bacterium]|nr:YncE family protein [Planctomycetota bacterium]